MKVERLPFFNERPLPINALVLHCSAHSAEEMVRVLKRVQLSAHYVIGLNGEIIKLVEEDKRAWHAGVSGWRGMENLNHNSIGIEISSLTLGQENYNQHQIDSLIRLCRELIERYNIPPQNVVGHSDIAPVRKADPGCAFPWKYLAQNGVGLWYNAAEAQKVAEDDAECLLREIGYDVTDLAAASYAFCRHFYPKAVDKVNDINELVENPYPKNFQLDEHGLKILKACWQKYKK